MEDLVDSAFIILVVNCLKGIDEDSEDEIVESEHMLYKFNITGESVQDLVLEFQQIRLEKSIPALSSHSAVSYCDKYLFFVGGETLKLDQNNKVEVPLLLI